MSWLCPRYDYNPVMIKLCHCYGQLRTTKHSVHSQLFPLYTQLPCGYALSFIAVSLHLLLVLLLALAIPPSYIATFLFRHSTIMNRWTWTRD